MNGKITEIKISQDGRTSRIFVEIDIPQIPSVSTQSALGMDCNEIARQTEELGLIMGFHPGPVELIQEKNMEMTMTKNLKECKQKDKPSSRGLAMYNENERVIQAVRLVDNFPILETRDLVGLTTERITQLTEAVEKVKNRMQQLNMKGNLTEVSAQVLSDFTVLGRPDRN